MVVCAESCPLLSLCLTYSWPLCDAGKCILSFNSVSRAVQYLDVEFLHNEIPLLYFFGPTGIKGEYPCRLSALRSMWRKASVLFRSWHRSRRLEHDSSKFL